jgi:hypothetical protein
MTAAMDRLLLGVRGQWRNFDFADLTGDGVPDLLMVGFELVPQLRLFHCESGAYTLSTYAPGTWTGMSRIDTGLVALKDLNQNGLPEAVYTTDDCQNVGCFQAYILEWQSDGLHDNSLAHIDGVQQFDLHDLNDDGITEIIIKGDLPCFGCEAVMVPWRPITIVYAWNGKEFARADHKTDMT